MLFRLVLAVLRVGTADMTADHAPLLFHRAMVLSSRLK
jgi:hypothetical protein